MAATDTLLDSVSTALAGNLGASMQELAAAASVGRTTLHRAFATREALVQAVAAHAVAEATRVFDAAGIDDAPAAEAFDALSASIVPLALAYSLLWAEPPIAQTDEVRAAAERLDDRFEAFFARGQAEGVFRPDVAPRWLLYSVGSQALAAWWGIHAGFVGVREAPRLFRETALRGVTS